ncbi:MAG: S8 family serine peptidase [Ginsengibacter sp.]
MKSVKHSLLSLFFISLSFATLGQGESVKVEAPKNWHLLDKAESGYYGISLDKAYKFISGKKSKTVIVAVIDSGIDTLHEDLQPVLWHNPKEIPGNGKDDDNNGYADDLYGWNFIGGKDGRNVKEDSYEVARVYYKLKQKYGDAVPDTSSVSPEQKEEIKMYQKAKEKIEGNETGGGLDLEFMKKINAALHNSDSILKIAMQTDVYAAKDLDTLNNAQSAVLKAKSAFYGMMKANNSLDQTNKTFLDDFDEYLSSEAKKSEQKSNPPKDYRGEIIKDDESDINDRFYGNNDVMTGTPTHGTFCAGLIGASRNNGKGIQGIADNVKIMMIRAVPDGDEHDKDIANAIRYAVDNGAQIISMSFGKDFSPEKNWVDDAVKYAESHNVLLVHAAGNDKENIDSTDNFPNPVYADGAGRAANFITVGASGDPANGGITASFSNYGKKEVDLFAPGVQVYSTMPGGNNYGKLSGTSFSCPIVAGVAALVLEYYPDLSAAQLKYVIEKSASPVSEKIDVPGSDEKVNLSDISKSGGIVNAYEAIKLASTIKGNRATQEPAIRVNPKLIQKKRG